MTLPGAISTMDRSSKRTFFTAVALAMIALWFAVAGFLPVEPEVISSTYLVSGQFPTAPPPGQAAQPPNKGFLTGQFDVRIPKRMRGQKVEIGSVTFHDAKGKRLATVKVLNLNRRLRVRTEGSPGPAGPGRPSDPTSLTAEPVEGKLHLWPLEEGIINFTAVTSDSFGIKNGDRVSAVITGSSGSRKFELRTKPSEVRGFGF